jgi:parallel beta-helix repeat protein
VTGQIDGILLEGGASAPGSRGHDVRLNYIDRRAGSEALGGLAAISLLRVRDTTVADNTVVNRPLGIGSLDASGLHIVRNRLHETRAGIYASRGAGLRIEANVLSSVENGATGIFGISLEEAEITGNHIERFEGPIALTNGANNRVTGNRLRRGLIGILAGPESGITLSGNHVEEMQAGGVVVGGGENATLSHNHVVRCGWDGVAFGDSDLPGAGIAALFVEGGVTVESCEVEDTGRPPTGQGTSPAVGIVAVYCDEHVIRNNRVTGPVAGVAQFGSYPALLVQFTGGRAEVTDNLFTGATVTELVGLRPWIFGPVDIRLDEVIFSGNRCRDLTPRAHVNRASVVVGTRRLSIVGNHVRADFRSLPSVDLVRTGIISAVGNVTNSVWVNPPLATTNVHPFPFNLFNVINV